MRAAAWALTLTLLVSAGCERAPRRSSQAVAAIRRALATAAESEDYTVPVARLDALVLAHLDSGASDTPEAVGAWLADLDLRLPEPPKIAAITADRLLIQWTLGTHPCGAGENLSWFARAAHGWRVVGPTRRTSTSDSRAWDRPPGTVASPRLGVKPIRSPRI